MIQDVVLNLPLYELDSTIWFHHLERGELNEKPDIFFVLGKLGNVGMVNLDFHNYAHNTL